MTFETIAKAVMITVVATVLGVLIVYNLVGYILVHFIMRFW
jgi:hypothetical protein